MFSTLNIAVAPSTAGDRACDLCRQKKVRCDMGNPCKSCTSRNLVCTFDTILKKRGPPSGRSAKTQRRQSKTSPGENVLQLGEDTRSMPNTHAATRFGAMLLALCAFAMTQPVQSHEEVSTPSRSIQARMFLEESLKMRMTVDFGEIPNIYMVLTSFFIFAFLFGSGQHRAANHRLREADDLALSMDMDKPQAYDSLDPETRDQWLRTYLFCHFYPSPTAVSWVIWSVEMHNISDIAQVVRREALTVTFSTGATSETITIVQLYSYTTFALQKRYTIKSRGSPTANACFIRAFGSFTSYSAHRDKTDSMGMISLLYLMEAYNAIDESVVGCWAGYCKYSYGHCEDFDRRLALRMFRAQERAREDWLAGSISSEPSTPLPSVHQLLESQQVDIVVTHFWLLNKIWGLCMSHGLLRDDSEHRELRLDFAYHVAYKFGTSCHAMNLHALEFHGVGIVEKIVDITMGLIKALNSSTQLSLEFSLTDYDPLTDKTTVPGPSVRLVLGNLHQIVQNLRGGSHDYVSRLTMALEAVPGYSGAAEPHHSVA
ncbi:hypothetical protein D6D18_07799 [Aureobasidium pullulans]|nr:hypothetical protein D6D18_07799 [Aureobasidium pullulans]